MFLISFFFVFQSASHPQASFDTVLSGTVWPSALIHGLNLLEEVGRILKPNGKLFLLEPTGKMYPVMLCRYILMPLNQFSLLRRQ